jgi:AcrR family transcriptional regulator
VETKDKIISAGKEFFAKLGYEETTMSMIAKHVGVKKPSLYAHYDSKEDIFKAVLDQEFTEYTSSVRDTLSDHNKSVLKTLYDLLLRLSLFDDQNSSDFYYRYSRYQPTGLRDMIIQKYEETEIMMVRLFDELINRGKAQGEIDQTLTNQQIYDTYFLLVDGLSTTPIMYKEEYKHVGIQHIWKVFERGISPPQ